MIRFPRSSRWKGSRMSGNIGPTNTLHVVPVELLPSGAEGRTCLQEHGSWTRGENSVAYRSLVGSWRVRVDGSDGRCVCDVQRRRVVSTTSTGRHVEQRVVLVVCICSHQLHQELGIRMLRGTWLLDRSIFVYDSPAQTAPEIHAIDGWINGSIIKPYLASADSVSRHLEAQGAHGHNQNKERRSMSSKENSPSALLLCK